MATTKKEGAPAKERPSRSSLTPTAMPNPRARATKQSSPATRSSEKEDAAVPTSQRKPTPNYLKPTFSSCPEAAKQTITRASQKSLPNKKGLDAKPLHQRSSSFNTPRVQAKPALSSRSSFSERTSKGKATHPSRKVDSPPRRKPSVPKGKCSSVTSATSSNASNPTSPRAATEGALSNEDKEAALDILNLDMEETVLLEIPPVVEDNTAFPDESAHVENDPEELTAFVEQHEHVVNPAVPDEEVSKQEQHDGEAVDDSEEGKKEDDTVEEEVHEEVPTMGVKEKEHVEKPGEADEEAMVEGLGSDGGGVTAAAAAAAKVESDEGEEEAGVDGGGEKVESRVSGMEDEAAATEKRKEAAQQQQQQRKEAPPAYNDVIEETASKLVEKRKSKVKALVGAFETVIVLDSGGQAQ